MQSPQHRHIRRTEELQSPRRHRGFTHPDGERPQRSAVGHREQRRLFGGVVRADGNNNNNNNNHNDNNHNDNNHNDNNNNNNNNNNHHNDNNNNNNKHAYAGTTE
jgi:hypothetical protein